MNIKDDISAPPLFVPKGIDIKPKQQSAPQAATPAEPQAAEAIAIPVPEFKPIDYNGYDLNTTLGIILQTLSDVSQKNYYGVSLLTDVLRGSDDKRIIANGLNRCAGYGKLADVKREDVQFLVEWLIENGYILKTRGRYPVLHPTYNGVHYGEVITRQKLQALRRKLRDTESGGEVG